MYIYFSVLIFAWLISYFADKRDNKRLLMVVVLLVSGLAGLRSSSVGTDTITYARLITYIMSGSSSYFIEEPGFVFLVKTIGGISKNINFVFFVIALITNALILFRFWSLKKYVSFSTMTSLYFAMYYPQTMNIMRQFLAISIVFSATYFLEKKSYIKFLLFVFLATTIHQSAYISIFMLPISYYYLNRKTVKRFLLVLMSCMCVPVFYMITQDMIQESYLYLLDLRQSGWNIVVIIKVVFFFLYYFASYRVYKNIEIYEISENTESTVLYDLQKRKIAIVIYFIGLVLLIVGSLFDQGERISYYYTFCGIPIAALAVKDNRYRQLFALAIVFVIGFYSIVKICIQGYCGIYPYISIL